MKQINCDIYMFEDDLKNLLKKEKVREIKSP